VPATYVSEGDPYEAQAEATTRAVVSLELVPALNDDDRHVDALSGIITNHLQGWP
jgi:protoheme ferro-lyase